MFVLLRAASDVLPRSLGVSQGVVVSEWGSEHHCYRVVFLGAACSNDVVCVHMVTVLVWPCKCGYVCPRVVMYSICL